jgi:hypothetical protein
MIKVGRQGTLNMSGGNTERFPLFKVQDQKDGWYKAIARQRHGPCRGPESFRRARILSLEPNMVYTECKVIRQDECGRAAIQSCP